MTATYLFIDGGYLRAARREIFQNFFASDCELDFARIKNSIGCLKAFYYDCHDEQRKDEDAEQFTKRHQDQIDEFNRIRACAGFHVVHGTLSARRQKEVDVALAVDMLMHAHAKNMTDAHLIAGDLDFRPLVKALVQVGIYVTVWSQRAHASTELRYAADNAREISVLDLYGWSPDAFRRVHRIPVHFHGDSTVNGNTVIATGVSAWANPVRLYWNGGHEPEAAYTIIADERVNGTHLNVRFEDRAFLERFFASVWGPIDWDEATPAVTSSSQKRRHRIKQAAMKRTARIEK